MLATHSSHELGEWKAFELIEPFGSPASAFEAGIIASTLANINRGKDTDPFSPSDFMPQIARPKAEKVVAKKKRQSDVVSRKLRAALMATFGGKS